MHKRAIRNFVKLSYTLKYIILICLVPIFLILFSVNSIAANYYVNDNSIVGDVFCNAIGNDANPGTSSFPFRTLLNALSIVSIGDNIYIDAGTYNEKNLVIPASLTGISIIGAGYQNTIFDHAFAGASTDFFICIQSSNTTIKSLTVKGYENNGTQFPGHSGQAITVNGTTSTITGILIEDVMLLGNGQSGGNPAISVLEKSDVDIRGGGAFCNASGSTYTGGVEAFGKNINLVIENYILADNFKDGFDGGGLRIEGDITTNVIVRNTRISNNVTVNGGGVAMYNGYLEMYNCIIDGNMIGQAADPIMGGGIFVSCGNLSLKKCIIKNNNENASGTFRGGGIAGRYNGTTGIFSSNKAINLTADSCIFSGNFGDNGKDIYAASGSGNPCNFTLINCIFSSPSTNIVSDATSPATSINVTYVGTAPTKSGSNITSVASTALLFDLSTVNPPDYSGNCPNIVILCNAPSPAGNQTQNFCSNQSPTIADLIAVGSSIQWYSSLSGGSPLLSTTPLVDGTTYYASQTLGGCESTNRLEVLVTVANLSTLTIIASGSTTLCPGDFVTLTSSSATGNTWSTGETTQSITVNAAGTYTVSVNSGGCSSTSLGTVVTVNSTPTITSSGSTTLCPGDFVTLTSSSATGNTWSTGESTQSITVNAAGTYTVSVNSGGCSSTSLGTIVTVNSMPTTPTISASGSTTLCPGESIVLTSSEPTGNIWSTGEITQSITVTVAGTYSVTFNSVGCSAVSTGITVTTTTTLSVPTISTSGSTTLCPGESIVLTSSEPTGNIWSTGEITQSITVNAAGTYSVTIPSGACSVTSTEIEVITNPSPTTPTISSNGSTILCPGGSVILTSSEQSGNIWSTGETTQSITVTSAGTYTVTFNSGGCSATSAGTLITINSSSISPTISASGPTTFCEGGSITLSSSFTNGNNWSTGETTQSITVTTSGNYTVTVISGGCSVTSAATTVTVNSVPTTPIISASGSTTLCSGSNVTLTSSSSIGNTWSTGETSQSITVSEAGTYSLLAIDINGCQSSLISQLISVIAAPTITILNDTICEGNETGVLVTSVSQLGGTYNWTPSVSTSGTLNDSPSLTTLYSVTYTLNGCSSVPAAGNIVVIPAPSASFSFNPLNFSAITQSISFSNNSTDGINYMWNFGDGNTSTVENPEHLFNSTENGYVISLLVSNLYGCTDEVQTSIGFVEGLDFYVPNSFTPDGDQFNNVFKPVFTSGFDPFNFHLSIFDRWGELIFESYDANIGWDGSLGTTGLSLQDGIYIWKIEFKKPSNDDKIKVVGHVSKIK